jgi:hypothetical protein
LETRDTAGLEACATLIRCPSPLRAPPGAKKACDTSAFMVRLVHNEG